MTDFLTHLQTAVGDTYRIERELASGGMSRLFLAEERSLGRTVVIKVLPPEFTSEVSAARFQREIRFAARLQHPHILPVLSCGDRDDILYFVMPYVAGESLRDRLARDGRLPVADAVRVLQQIADALAHAHAEGIVHRDIKPENILLSKGHAVLADFGVSQALEQAQHDGRLTDAGLIVGTPGYMAPEQAAGGAHVDARADVYTLALVGYEMLAGKPPFDGPTAQALIRAHLTETPRPLHEIQPDVPVHVSNVIDAALCKDPDCRIQSAAEFRDALVSPGPVARPRPPRRRWIGVAAALVLVGGAAGLIAVRSSGEPPLDTDLIAVAPFEVLEPDLELWREGVVDVVSRDLDGAGPLRTVAPTTVVRRWEGRPDVVSATALGHRTGAGLAVFGQLIGAGADSVRLTATLLDVDAGRPLAQFRMSDERGRVDRLADSLTVALLRELGRSRPIGSVRLSSIGSTSIPAIRAFLRAEQHFRRTDWDSALVLYNEALGYDSSFALAWRRIAIALGWQRSGFDQVARDYHLRAAGLNSGLAPRDSLLLLADSLSAAMYAGMQDTHWYRHARRLFDVVEEATRRYPEDPEAWYALGEARFHFGFTPDVSAGQRAALEAFDHAIALDSAYGPALIHPVDLALTLEGPATAQRYIDAYLALDPQDVNARSIRTLAAVLQEPDPARRRALLDTVPLEVARHLTMGGLGRWPDADELEIAMFRSAFKRFGDSLEVGPLLPAHLLAYRGHLADAFAEFGARAPVVVLWGGLLGVLDPDTVDGIFHTYQRKRSGAQQYAAPWWAARSDTVALLAHVETMDSLGTAHELPFLRPIYRYGAGAARGYLSLARRDTADALARFEALPDSLCPWCTFTPLTRVQLLVAAGRDQDAERALRRDLYAMFQPTTVLWALERGRVNERLGNVQAAADAYRFVTDVWRNADPALQPFVTEARDALDRLSAERRS